jgi:pimeloyl-ACP methyl ester carboxylesterase
VDIIGNSMGGAIALSIAAARLEVARRLVLMGPMGWRWPPPGLDTVWGYTPGMDQMRRVIGLFAHNRDLITDELVALRYRASLDPPVRDSRAAMFSEPRQRWLDDLALSGAELASIRSLVLMVHGRDDRVVPLAELIRPAPGFAARRAAARPVRLRALDDDRADG